MHLNRARIVSAVLLSGLMTAVVAAQDKPKFEYVGSTKCKKCHLKQYKSWEKTEMANAFELLKPGVEAERKPQGGLDPEKDYTKDTSCLGCHTVGYGLPGGYESPDGEPDKRTLAALGGTGCESCHGPGSEYIKIFQDINDKQRQYTLKELTDAGLVIPTETTCKTCHNEKDPFYDPAVPFDFEQRVKDGVHEHVELKLQKDG